MATRTRIKREVRSQLERIYEARLDELYSKLSAFRETSESQQAEIEQLKAQLATAEAAFLDARKAAWYLWEGGAKDEWAVKQWPWLAEDEPAGAQPSVEEMRGLLRKVVIAYENTPVLPWVDRRLRVVSIFHKWYERAKACLEGAA